MKRVFKGICLLLAMVFLTTGCFNYDVEMSINDDNSLDFKMGMNFDFTALSEEFGDDFDESAMDDIEAVDKKTQSALKEKGYEVEEKRDGLKYSVNITKKFDNLDDLTTDKDIKVDVDKMLDGNAKEVFFKKEKSGSKTKYTAYFIFDLTDDTINDVPDEYKDMLKASYVVNLGNKVKVNTKSTNATSISDNNHKLTWELEVGKKTEAIYEFEIQDASSMYIIIVCVALLVVLTAVGVVIIKKQKPSEEKKDKEVASE